MVKISASDSPNSSPSRIPRARRSLSSVFDNIPDTKIYSKEDQQYQGGAANCLDSVDVVMVVNNNNNNGGVGGGGVVVAGVGTAAENGEILNSSGTMVPSDSSAANGGSTGGVPKAILQCRANSHPFQDRTLILEQPVKIGRSVGRARVTVGNAIFDCKVLSRNHALLWYENGKFYLQDTKSSNGTFVNNQRLSKGSEESSPREVCSSDVLQFGVDVMENSRKVTHGCIIATLKLFLPDGKEAKASPTITNSDPSTMGNLTLPTPDLYQLNRYIKEALAREQLLETKLAHLQRLVGETETASSDAWKSLIDEDRLLTRVEILESQLSTYGKGMNEDKLREETKRLMEEKEEYQERAKDTLKKLVNEKLEAVKKLQDVEKTLSNTEDEYASLRELYEGHFEENKRLAEEVDRLTKELETVKAKLPPPEAEASISNSKDASELASNNTMDESADVIKSNIEPHNESEVETNNSSEPTSTSSSSAIPVSSHSEAASITSLSSSSADIGGVISNVAIVADKNDILNASTDTLSVWSTPSEAGESDPNQDQLQETAEKYEVLKRDNEAVNNELIEVQQQLCEALKLLDEKCRLLDDLELVTVNSKNSNNSATTSSNSTIATTGENPPAPPPRIRHVNVGSSELKETKVDENSDDEHQQAQPDFTKEGEVRKLLEDRQVLEAENKRLQSEVSSHLQVIEEYEAAMQGSSTSTLMNTSSSANLEKSLLEAESKISELLKVKEKYAEVNEENSKMATSMSELREEMNLMGWQTKAATVCAIVPVAVVLLAFLVSYLPGMSG